jgi:hypothetical protein
MCGSYKAEKQESYLYSPPFMYKTYSTNKPIKISKKTIKKIKKNHYKIISRVANFESEVQPLKLRESGAVPERPTI